MERILGKRWADKAIFMAIAVLVMLGVRHITVGPAAKNRPVQGVKASDFRLTPVSMPEGGKIMLYLGRETLVGPSRITYRGHTAGTIRLDLRIPALDSAYTYRREISLEEARSSMRLAGADLRLETVRMGYAILAVRSM